MQPSTQWREDVAPDEAERFARYAKGLVAAQRRRNDKYGRGRALHRKQILALEAELEVLEDLPEHARQGLFARPGKHEALIRLSNGSMEDQPDRKPDIRGFSFKVFGVDGPNALGTGNTTSQDFTLINQTSFSAPKAAPFAELVLALDRGPLALLGHLFRTYGFRGALREIKKANAIFGKPFSGFATETFNSVVPIACGRWACRVRLVPPPDAPKADRDPAWADDVKKRLEVGPLVFRVQLQFFVDESITPIEDASVDWPETEAPYVDVARLVVPQQAFDGEAAEARRAAAEREIFDPWNALADHRPLGDVMRARKVAYFESQKARGAVAT